MACIYLDSDWNKGTPDSVKTAGKLKYIYKNVTTVPVSFVRTGNLSETLEN